MGFVNEQGELVTLPQNNRGCFPGLDGGSGGGGWGGGGWGGGGLTKTPVLEGGGGDWSADWLTGGGASTQGDGADGGAGGGAGGGLWDSILDSVSGLFGPDDPAAQPINDLPWMS